MYIYSNWAKTPAEIETIKEMRRRLSDKEDEIVYANCITVLNYDGTYLLWFAWCCYFRDCTPVCNVRCVCVWLCIMFTLPLQMTIPECVSFKSIAQVVLAAGCSCYSKNCSMHFDCEMQATYTHVHSTHTYEMNTTIELQVFRKTYNFNLIWP